MMDSKSISDPQQGKEATEPEPDRDRDGEAASFLTFVLGGEIFALAVEQVREVVDIPAVTPVPRMPDYLRGVMNLRGSVVGVVDLGRRLGLGAFEKTTEDACLVILDVTIDDEPTPVAALADGVREVIDLDTGRMIPPPRLGTRLRTDFIRAVGEYDGRLVIVPDIDRIFSAEGEENGDRESV